MKCCLKWVHMARCELILRLDGALWLRTIFKPLLTQKLHIKNKKCQKTYIIFWALLLSTRGGGMGSTKKGQLRFLPTNYDPADIWAP